MKKIMILGATLTQIPLIKKSKELGYNAIVASIDGNYPAFDYADEICYVDITDPEAVLEKAKELKIEGIATCCMDTPVRALGYVCEKMGLKGLSSRSASLCNNKLLMKQAFMDNGVNTARYLKIESEEELENSFNTLEFPLIIKAVDLQASRGIYVAHTPAEARNGYIKAMQLTHQKFCIIEEFIVGEEFGAQAFVYHGEVLFVLPHGDYTFYTNAAMPVGHFAPLELPREVITLAEEQAKKAIKAVGLDNCAVNIDMIYKEGKVYMIELTGRAGATNLCELVGIYYGVDYYKMISMMAMGEDPNNIFNNRASFTTPVASKFVMSNKTGVLKEIIDNNDMQNENICEYVIHVKKGESINKFADGKDRIGYIIVKGKSTPECLQSIDKFLENIEIVLE